MGTRSITLIRDNDGGNFSIYRQYDGYPEGMIPEFADALDYAWELPRYEADDMTAAVICQMKLGSKRKSTFGGYTHQGGNVYAYTVKELDDLKDTWAEWVYIIDNKNGVPSLEVYPAGRVRNHGNDATPIIRIPLRILGDVAVIQDDETYEYSFEYRGHRVDPVADGTTGLEPGINNPQNSIEE